MSDYLPPVMSNGKTWADEAWWLAAGQKPPSSVETFDDAEQLTWARCWAYGEAMGMTTREWHLMWPIVYGALDACSRINHTREPETQDDDSTDLKESA